MKPYHLIPKRAAKRALKEGMKKRVYMTTSKVAYANREKRAGENLIWFREQIETFEKKNPRQPTECKVGFKLYEDLLLAVSKDTEPKKPEIYLDTLFGIKIYIDPSLKSNEVKIDGIFVPDPKPLYISKHTPKEQAVVFRKINQIIKWILAKD
jgi:hypothetical protein